MRGLEFKSFGKTGRGDRASFIKALCFLTRHPPATNGGEHGTVPIRRFFILMRLDLINTNTWHRFSIQTQGMFFFVKATYPDHASSK